MPEADDSPNKKSAPASRCDMQKRSEGKAKTDGAVEGSDGAGLRQSLMAVTDGVLGAALLIVLGVWAGGFLDQKFSTTPWLSITLSLLGGGLGLARLVVKAINIGRPAKSGD